MRIVGLSYSQAVGTSFFHSGCTSIYAFLPSSSVSLSYFIVAVSMCNRLGIHLCMSTFPIAILNDTGLFARRNKFPLPQVAKSIIIINNNNSNIITNTSDLIVL